MSNIKKAIWYWTIKIKYLKIEYKYAIKNSFFL
jgi:hypothetical protein